MGKPNRYQQASIPLDWGGTFYGRVEDVRTAACYYTGTENASSAGMQAFRLEALKRLMVAYRLSDLASPSQCSSLWNAVHGGLTSVLEAGGHGG